MYFFQCTYLPFTTLDFKTSVRAAFLIIQGNAPPEG